MSQAETPILSSVVAVYPDHATAEAVRQLHEAGFGSAISRSWAATFRRPRSRTALSAAATTPRLGRRPGRGSGGCSACSLVRDS